MVSQRESHEEQAGLAGQKVGKPRPGSGCWLVVTGNYHQDFSGPLLPPRNRILGVRDGAVGVGISPQQPKRCQPSGGKV